MRDLDTHARNDWCPGCGNFAIINAVKTVLTELNNEGIPTEFTAGLSQPDCDFDMHKFRHAQETMVRIAFRKFGVKGRHKDFPFANREPVLPMALPGPMTAPKKNLNACPQFLVVPCRCCIYVFFHHSGVQAQPARTFSGCHG